MKKSYEKPALKIYGDVAEITKLLIPETDDDNQTNGHNSSSGV